MNKNEYDALIKDLENICYNDITCYGWYDYKFWNSLNSKYTTLDSGYFDNNWN